MHLVGLAAFIAFALTFIPAVRARFIAKLFGGIARQHRVHHWLGFTTGVIILIHLLYETLREPESAFSLEDPFLLMGWIASVLMFAGLFFSVAKTLTHRFWIWFHWSLFISLVAAACHGFAYLHDATLDRLVFYTSSAIVATSTILILASRQAFSAWTVTGINEITPNLHEILLKQEKKESRGFKAGSVVFAQFGADFSRTWHPFSVASCQFSPVMRLLIKSVGTDTSHLEDLREGSSMSIHGPFPEFNVPRKQDQVWIAAGVGIAPFLGLTRCLDFQDSGKIRLIHYQAPDDWMLAGEFEGFQKRYPQFQWKNVMTARATFDELNTLAEGLDNPAFLICGPPAFMKGARKFLKKQGVSSSNIHTEEFSPW